MDPIEFAQRMRRLRQPVKAPLPPNAWRSMLRETFVVLDLSPHLADRRSSLADHSAVSFPCLLDDNPPPAQVAEAWRQVLAENRNVSAAEGLLFEFHACMRPLEFASALPKAYSFVKTLHVIRCRTGIALHDLAREVNWRRPILFVSILKIARRYHRTAVSFQTLTREPHRREFTGRLGVSTVLISRYEPVDLDSATEAVEALRASLEQGNDPEVATPYLLEAMSVLFDLTGDSAILEAALTYAGAPDDVGHLNAGWALASTEAALRLHDELASSSRRTNLRDYCANMLDRCEHWTRDAEDVLRRTFLVTMLRALSTGAKAGIRGFRSPFGFRHADLAGDLTRLVPDLIRAVRPLTRTGEPLARSIYADLLDHVPTPDEKRLPKLRLAVSMRGPGDRWSALDDERSLLLTCRDRLKLADLLGIEAERVASLEALIDLSARSTCATAALVLISEDIEKSGPSEVRESAQWGDEQLRVADMIRRGEYRRLLATSAADALASPDLSVLPLGGRGGVVTVSDYFDVVGGTFVFKNTTALSWRRELRRSEALSQALRNAELDDRFGVVDHLSPTEDELAGLPDDTKVSSVRRFASGVVLSKYVATHDRDRRIRAIAFGAAYLGHINSLESHSADTPRGMRKDVKAKEVGRWLKRLEVPDVVGTFNAYWSFYEDLPAFRRRDAHPLNWLVVSEHRLLAVDLEATGWRPLTYELAQLTEDSCLVEAGDWDARLSILEAYLGACGAKVTDRIIAAFEASVVARSLRKLTPPTGFGQTLRHGLEVLDFLSKDGSDPRVRKLATDIAIAWQDGRGLSPRFDSLNLEIKDSRRRRISRSLAFHLRHDPSVDRDSAGWADVEGLAVRIGHGTTPTEIALVASDFREPRFELEGLRIRALYGHTLHANIERSDPDRKVALFHATSLSVADAVLTRKGLAPMERQFVHLSSSPAAAVRAGSRHGIGLLLTVESDHLTNVRHAAESTYVAESIPPALLRVAPIWFDHGTISELVTLSPESGPAAEGGASS